MQRLPHSIGVICLVFIATMPLPWVNGQSETDAKQLNHWARFRGPDGSGLNLDSKFAMPLGDNPFAWQVDLPGVGNSSPVVWGDRVLVTSSDPDTAQLTLSCLSMDGGTSLWQRTFDSQTHHLHSRNTFATSTPAVDADHVYIVVANERHTFLIALDHAGNEQWKQDFGPFVSSHGFGTSPIVYRDRVILFDSQQVTELDSGVEPGLSQMIAVRCEDGRPLWKRPMDSKRACYGVPCIYSSPDMDDQIVCADTANGFFSIDPENGKLNWSTPGLMSRRIVATPIITGDMLMTTEGSGGGGNTLFAMRLNQTSSTTAATEAFRVRRASYVPSPIAVGGLLFMFIDKGIIQCLDAGSGSPVWDKRAARGFSGSPVATSTHVYCVDEQGKLHAVAVSRTCEHRIAAELNEPSRSTPAIVGDQMLLRSESKLFLIGER